MSKDPLYEQLREISWRRKLTPSEEFRLNAWLAAHPEAEAEWASEAALNEALAALPKVPVANNFTARVVAAAQSQAARQERSRFRLSWVNSWWRRWLPQSALVAAVLGAGLLSYNHFVMSRREEVARSLATMSQVPSLPNPDVLKDFDTIATLSSAPLADEELLKVMQ
jgi:anti-sigma factor RsiW